MLKMTKRRALSRVLILFALLIGGTLSFPVADLESSAHGISSQHLAVDFEVQASDRQKPACSVQGIRRIYTSPDRVRFQVQYYLSPNHPKAAFIRAYVPNKEHQSSRFGCDPAGRHPRGIPKGQHHFADNVVVDVEYTGPQPYTTSTIEVAIYDKDENLCSSVIRWGQTWQPSPLTTQLNQSLLVRTVAESQQFDRDRDGLVDSQESKLANAVRPYLRFDSAEAARKRYEPVTLFQVRPLDVLNDRKLKVKIKWVFLFRRDGGYGPDSWCSDAHGGDNDTAFYELESQDGGITWKVVRIGLGSEGGLEWQSPRSGLEIHNHKHPVIYMSAHKHHEYFDTSYDHEDSYYSSWGCNDDVNGRGDTVLVDLLSVAKHTSYNNVGEPDAHPTPPFVNALDLCYPGHSAWGKKDFYSVSSIRSKWMTHSWIRRLLAPVPLSPADGTTFSHNPRRTTLTWQHVPHAVSYTVEVQRKYAGAWYPTMTAPGITTTSYTFDFVGAQPGRWRVWAVGEHGQQSAESEWREFRYTR
jgi:hypothetical protein